MAEGGITREWLEELRSRNDIVTTVSRYVPLQKKGRNYWGRCPFHHEKTPSFSVDESRQFFHCFGCGEGGDVIKFVGKIENLGFFDTVKLLAEWAHMEVPSQSFSKVDEGAKKKRDDMYAINRLAARRYHENLSTPAGKAASEYLASRGVTPAMIRKFGLGVSVDYDDIVRTLRANGCDLSLANEGGLIGMRKNEATGAVRYYDYFGGRLIFPIQDSYGNVIGFGGRILVKDPDKAKYRNTGATFVFDKSKSIYAINLIKKKKLTENVDTLILCEGYVDVIALHQAGFDTAVASMGTSLTQEQCRTLARFAKKIVISYDGDAAGQKATLRGLELLKDNGLEVRVISLPDGLDPDDLIRKRGAEAYRKCLDDAVPYFDFKLSVLAKEYKLDTFDGRTRFATAAVDEIRKLDNKLEQEQYLRRVQSMSGFRYDSLLAQLASEVTEDGVARAPAEEQRTYSATEKAARFVLFSVVNRASYALDPPDLAPLLSDDGQRAVFEAFRSDKRLTLASAYSSLPEELHAALNAVADDDQGIDEPLRESYYSGCARTAAKALLEEELSRLSSDYDRDIMNAGRQETLRRIVAIQNELKRYK